VVYLKVLSSVLVMTDVESQENPQDSGQPGRDPNRKPPEYRYRPTTLPLYCHIRLNFKLWH
jgi:hypothetical protein